VFTMTAMSAAEASEATARACCGEGPAERLRGGGVGAAGLRWLWGLVADCQRPPSLASKGNTPSGRAVIPEISRQVAPEST